MLTDLEKSRLLDTKSEKSSTKRYNDFTVKKKLESWIGDIEDVGLILNQMDYKKLDKIITPDTFLSLARISEAVIDVAAIPRFTGRDTVIVGGGPKGRVRPKKGETTAPIAGVKEGLFVVRQATEAEKVQVDQLKTHILNLLLRLGKDDLLDVIEEAEKIAEVS